MTASTSRIDEPDYRIARCDVLRRELLEIRRQVAAAATEAVREELLGRFAEAHRAALALADELSDS